MLSFWGPGDSGVSGCQAGGSAGLGGRRGEGGRAGGPGQAAAGRLHPEDGQLAARAPLCVLTFRPVADN